VIRQSSLSAAALPRQAGIMQKRKSHRARTIPRPKNVRTRMQVRLYSLQL